jgi:RHS repeat-associated protein
VSAYSNRNELLSRPGVGYLYDMNGNLVQKTEGANVWTYEWDAENRLKVARVNGVQMGGYVYDALGRRAERHWGWGMPNHREYVYDGEDILLSEYSHDFEAGSNFDMMSHFYIHGPGIDEPFEVQFGGSTTWYYHADALGSIVRMTDENGEDVRADTYRQYDAFGKPEWASYEGHTYTGREWDPETGLYYYRARYYDPRIGRFLSEDPLGLAAGINFYSYIENNPANMGDPSGRSAYLRCDNIEPNDWTGFRRFGLKAGEAILRGPNRHCYIEVECPGRWRVTLELNGETPCWPNGFTLMRNSGFKPRTSDTASAIDSCGCPGSCAFEEELLNQFSIATDNRGEYNPLLNNSNTFVATIIANSGGAATFPSGAIGHFNSKCR